MSDRFLELFLCDKHAGRVYQDTSGKLSFSYFDVYEGPDLSLSMPRNAGVFGDKTVRPWLLGLLPDDRAVRKIIAREHGVSPDNPFDLLSFVGLDCPGAVQLCSPDVLDEVFNQQETLKEVNDDEIKQRLEATEGQNPSWIAKGEGWSLGGNQGKIALRFEEGRWFQCLGAAPTTHILKPGVSGLRSQALTEYICMKLASACGLPASHVDYHEFKNMPAIIVERYDRVRDSKGAVKRLHQEDFCQALGVLPDKKYASDGGPNANQCLSMLQSTQDPNTNTAQFLQMLFFNCALGAPDAHAKNYSLLHLSGQRALLAPLYDVASGLPYSVVGGGKWKLAMSLGGENRLGMLRRGNIEKLAADNSLDSEASYAMAIKTISDVLSNAQKVFDECAHIDGIDDLRARFEIPLLHNCEHLLSMLD